MISALFVIAILLERSLGTSVFIVPMITVMLFEMEKENLPKTSLLAGLIIDMFFGHKLGLSSLLLLLSSLEISLYKSKIESSNLWSLFLLGILISVQASIFWGISQPTSTYFIHATISVLIFTVLNKISRAGSRGIYLRR